MEQLLIDISNLKQWLCLGIIVTTNNTDAELINKVDTMYETVVKNLNIPDVSNCNYKEKYDKCISIIKRFDAGIIGMYDL